MKKLMALTVMGIAACMLHASAQDNGDPRQGPPPGGGTHPKPPLETALDANGDGVIDADEIANAPAALKKLDKNGDGKLTQDECMPPRPQGGEGRRGGGQGGGQGGQGGGDGRRGGPGQGGHDGQGPDGQGVAGGGAQRPELEK